MTTKNDRLTEFVESRGGNTDTLSIEERETAEMQLGKAGAFERRDMDEQADTLRGEVAELLGTETVDTDTDTDSDTLSKEAVAEYLSDYETDTLNSQWKTEQAIETLESKISSFENRGVDKRAAELRDEITVLEAALDEADKSNKKYQDIDTLAGRVVRKGQVLEVHDTGDGADLTSRETGETVVLKESEDVDTLGRPMNPRQVNRAVTRVVDGAILGGSQ